nr:biotin carboxylase [Micromonospora sp. NRRL B-16802]
MEAYVRILVLHQNKFDRLGYANAFDHTRHDVTYAGTAGYIDTIPADVRCTRVVLEPDQPVVDQLRPRLLAWPPFDRILTRHELLIAPAAELRAEFGVRGMRPDLARNFRDKVAMKTAVAGRGLRVPRFLPATDLLKVDVEVPWRGRTIVKPRGGSASRGVSLCEDFHQAREFVAREQRGDASFAERYEVEEYVEGGLWQIDGFLFRGEPVAIQASRYVGSCLSFENGGPLGVVQRPHPELEAFAVDCLRALGGDTLTFHLEAITTPQGPVFLEAAARCGGGYTVTAFRRRTGIHLHTLDMATEVADELATEHIHAPETTELHGEFQFPGHVYGGAPITVDVPAELLADPRVLTYQVYPAGKPTPMKGSYRPENLPLSGLITDSDPDVLESWLSDLFAKVTVTPQSGVPAPLVAAQAAS